MPIAIATQIEQDGPRNTTTKTTGDIGGTSQAVATIITAATLTDMNPGQPGTHAPTLLRIDNIEYSITDGIIVQLFWHATANVLIVELYGRGKIEAKSFGGLQNNAGAGVTGDIDMAIIASGAVTPTDASVLLVMKMVKFRPISVGGA
jgi:hypothetical protein